MRAAAHEVYDLQPVAGEDRKQWPATSRRDLAVSFDGDSIGLQTELRHHGFECAAVFESLDLPNDSVHKERKRHVSKLSGRVSLRSGSQDPRQAGGEPLADAAAERDNLRTLGENGAI